MNDQLKDEQPEGENKAMVCLRCGGVMLECQPHISAGTVSTLGLWPLDKHGLFDLRSSGVRVFFCENCGYMEFQATNVAELLPKPPKRLAASQYDAGDPIQ